MPNHFVSNSTQTSPAEPSSLDILVVEDSLTQALALKNLLRKQQYRVAVVHNGREAISYLESNPVHMVISDINMPEMDGYEMCFTIKCSPRFAHIPVILLTTLSDSQNILQGLKAQADYYLTKPYDPDYLIARVKSLFQRSEAEAGIESERGLEILLNGSRHIVTANRRQMLNLLLSTYENAVQQNRELTRTQLELQSLNRELRDRSQRLQISEKNFRALLESNADAMVVVDASGVARFANPAAAQLFGAATPLVGLEFPFTFSSDQTREVIINRSEGTSAILELRVVETTWEGAGAWLAALRDITRRKEDERKIREQQVKLEEANEKLRALATLDGLTGVKNHRAFKERLADEFRSAQLNQTPLSLVLLDVDRFKDYNDAFGHPEGDEVLRSVARFLEQSVRAEDMVARYGGEEFVIVLPHRNIDAASQIAERIRASIAGAAWPLRLITASFGVATLRADIQASSDLVAKADAALYQAKQAGRNRVIQDGL